MKKSMLLTFFKYLKKDRRKKDVHLITYRVSQKVLNTLELVTCSSYIGYANCKCAQNKVKIKIKLIKQSNHYYYF